MAEHAVVKEKERKFAATAITQGLGIGNRIYMKWKDDIVIIEVARYENGEKVVCKYPDGKYYYPSGGTIEGICEASNAAAQEKTDREREASNLQHETSCETKLDVVEDVEEVPNETKETNEPGCKTKLHGCGTRMIIGGDDVYDRYRCEHCKKCSTGKRWFCVAHKSDYCFDCHPLAKKVDPGSSNKTILQKQGGTLFRSAIAPVYRPARFDQSRKHERPERFDQSRKHGRPARFDQSRKHERPKRFEQSRKHVRPDRYDQSRKVIGTRFMPK